MAASSGRAITWIRRTPAAGSVRDSGRSLHPGFSRPGLPWSPSRTRRLTPAPGAGGNGHSGCRYRVAVGACSYFHLRDSGRGEGLPGREPGRHAARVPWIDVGGVHGRAGACLCWDCPARRRGLAFTRTPAVGRSTMGDRRRRVLRPRGGSGAGDNGEQPAHPKRRSCAVGSCRRWDCLAWFSPAGAGIISCRVTT